MQKPPTQLQKFRNLARRLGTAYEVKTDIAPEELVLCYDESGLYLTDYENIMRIEEYTATNLFRTGNYIPLVLNRNDATSCSFQVFIPYFGEMSKIETELSLVFSEDNHYESEYGRYVINGSAEWMGVSGLAGICREHADEKGVVHFVMRKTESGMLEGTMAFGLIYECRLADNQPSDHQRNRNADEDRLFQWLSQHRTRETSDKQLWRLCDLFYDYKELHVKVCAVLYCALEKLQLLKPSKMSDERADDYIQCLIDALGLKAKAGSTRTQGAGSLSPKTLRQAYSKLKTDMETGKDAKNSHHRYVKEVLAKWDNYSDGKQ